MVSSDKETQAVLKDQDRLQIGTQISYFECLQEIVKTRK